MAISSLEKFYEDHPYPDKKGITSLFRFYKIDLDQIGHLIHLFRYKKLFHSLPIQFNDPFECKPYFSWPQETKKINEIRKYLIKLSMKEGYRKEDAESLASISMENESSFQTIVINAAQKSFAEIRICSFTTQKDNLLLWSHYADSHKGFCVEFDATAMPISSAFMVQYKDQYPEALYPTPKDESALTPALVKSKVWKYEEEFRSFIFSGSNPLILPNDGESLILNGNEIKNIYLGANIHEDKKKLLLDIVKNGSFKPGIWSTSLAKSTFGLEFTQIV